MRFRTPGTVFTMTVVAALSGCGWFGGDEEAADAEADSLGDIPPLQSVEPPPPVDPDHRLELKLQVGQRFPLMKTVEQTLSQVGDDGALTTDRTQLQMLLEINVEEVVEDRKRLGVRYHRVRYFHDIGGEQIAYDSAARKAVPSAARAYQGLAGNGFSFWINARNEIVDLVGFEPFLERCLEHVPVEERNAVLAELSASQGEEGIANFVDDSIGLLPYEPVRVGHQWRPPKRLYARPVPIYALVQCTLKSLDDEYAAIDISGRISQSSTFGPGDQTSGDVQLAVKDGFVMGECQIRRDSGLPAKSHIERFFDMTVRLADGTTFDQKKRVVTTIVTFEQQSQPRTIGPDPTVTPAAASLPESGSGDTVIEAPVIPADFESPS